MSKLSDKYKIHFGMPTLIEINTIRENAKLCSDLGLDFLELNMNLPICTILGFENSQNDVKLFLEDLKKLKNEFGIYFTIHLDENFTFADFNPLISHAYLQTLKNLIENAKEIDCPIINLHMNSGVYFTLPDKKVFLFEKYADFYQEKVTTFIENTKSWTQSSSVKLSIENTDGWKDFEKFAISKMLSKDFFGLTFDIGHSEAIGNLDESFILENKERLIHFHIHDGTLPDSETQKYGKNHLELGTGNIDLGSRLKLARENSCRCVIETKTVDSLKKSVHWLKEN